MRFFLFTTIFLSLSFCLVAQTIFEEDFNGGSLPNGWEIETLADDAGWIVGTPSSLSSQFFEIANNNSGNIIATNDDECNCDKSEDRLISPAIDLSDVESAVLTMDLFYRNDEFQGNQEEAAVYVSTDKENWEKLSDLQRTNSWERQGFVLNDYTGQEVYVSIEYNDDGGWLFGCGIDNFNVSTLLALDASLDSESGRFLGEVGVPYNIPSFTLFNQGGTLKIRSLSKYLSMVNLQLLKL